jgi:hypothetical protein
MREMLDDLLPPGALWKPEEEEGFDLLLDGMAENYEHVRAFLSVLSDIRNPNLTPILSDLEREYGVSTDLLLTEEVRRQRLAAQVYARSGTGTIDDMQNALDNAGFDVQVHSNDPAVDPNLFIAGNFQMVAGGDNAYAGNQGAFVSQSLGELLVNGEIFSTEKIFDSLSGAMFSGDGYSGSFLATQLGKKIYSVPTDPTTWPLIFFVGGDATRDPGTGALTDIEMAEVESSREQEFKSLILRYKPLHTWAGLIVFYA